MKLSLVKIALGLSLFVIAAFAWGQNPAVNITVDAQANRNPISPLIYGVNIFESPDVTSVLEDLNCPLNRYGGNRASTYNWTLNSDNRGNDYFFESISDDTQIAGARGDIFITATKAASAEPMVTIPMLDWIAKAGTAQPFLCSYPKGTFPNQALFDEPYDPNCGDGLLPDFTTMIDGANPTIALTPNSLATQQSWIQHILASYGSSTNGGLKYYILDNEHDLWWGTHHDAVPNAPHYTEDRDRMISYGQMIKSLDPNALVVGPEISGWVGYLLSPADFEYGQQTNYAGGIDTFPDRIAINHQDYAPWLLSQFQAYDKFHHGQRLLDVFTVHYYPQGGNNNENTRSLWDPNYVDPSYIGDKVMLIPRMKQWVAGNYPGTKIGVTEYNWGSINQEEMYDNIGYAVTQADVLGIFGREGLDLATRFNAPPAGLPTYNAMKMYRNYDGNKSTFGDVSTLATVANPDTVAAFSAQRTSDNKLTVMLLSKYATGNTPASVSLGNFKAAGTAQVWQLSGAGTAIQNLADATISNSSVSLSLPPQSITLLVFTPAAALAAISPGTINFGSQLLRSYSTQSTVTVRNGGSASLSLMSISLSGTGLYQTNNCPVSLAVGASCKISIAPTAAGPLNGVLTVNDNAPDSPQQVMIAGNGISVSITPARPTRPQPNPPSAAAIAQSVVAPMQLTVDGNTGPITLQCGGAPVKSRCRVEPSKLEVGNAIITKEVAVILEPERNQTVSRLPAKVALRIMAVSEDGSRLAELPVTIATDKPVKAKMARGHHRAKHKRYKRSN